MAMLPFLYPQIKRQRYLRQADGKAGRKVRPGFQTWTPRRGRGDGLLEEETGSDSALDAAKAAAAAALGSTQTQSKTSAGVISLLRVWAYHTSSWQLCTR